MGELKLLASPECRWCSRSIRGPAARLCAASSAITIDGYKGFEDSWSPSAYHDFAEADGKRPPSVLTDSGGLQEEEYLFPHALA